ncbi:peptidoglycan D,D-transpeptidase FtsI family protein [Sphingomonas oligoaromativorans]|uniref:peptidoglycan D,D-transpeptidase FtsI family protein n=1 Tax=Sphingomonas oligoaromativorans TaxID=575322 RepID=UPI0014233302|nr:cell division protein FtsI (penicillin-binding protein 3) [Sphingomonas oligoaromativorans]
MTATVTRPDRVRLAGQRQQSLALVHFRLMVVMLLFLGVVGVIALRLLWISIFAGSAPSTPAADGLLPARGDIVDRNGVPLARTIQAWSIGLHPKQLVNDPMEVAKKLAAVMPEHSVADYYAMLKSNKNFIYLRRRATPELVAEVNTIGEPAIALAREPERLYPQTTLAAHVLGWTDIDGRGVFGMEKVLNNRLLDPNKRGTPVALSIDSRVQAAMEAELGAAVQKFTAAGGEGLVLDVRTGEVIAMTSFPTFNPNDPGATPIAALKNNATQSVYELGSTFKAITIANAIDSGVVTSMTKKYDATQPLQIGRYKIHDDHPANRWLNVPEMMVLSSNIVTARIADELGKDREVAMFKKLGFDKPPAVELTASARPLWPTYWGRTTVMTVGFGHGIAVTPLNLAIAYAALVNGGVYHPATLLKRGPDNPVPEGHRVISEATSARVRQLLRLVVLPVADGTGKKADVPGFRLGGKTGTAEVAQGGGYNHKLNVSTFAGVFPMDDPRYVIMMTLDSPHGTKDTFGFTTAAWVVGPAIAHTVARIGPLLGVIPDERHDVDESELLPLLWRPDKAKKAALTGAAAAAHDKD